MTLTQRKFLSVGIGAAVSIVLMLMLFQNIEFHSLITILQGVNYYLLLPNLFLVLLAIYQRAYRWKFMMDPIKVVPFSRLLAATSIGFMANNVLPLRLGEFVRAYSLSYQESEISKSASLATIFVERIVFDLIALLMIFGAIITLSELPIDPAVYYGSYFAIGIAIVGVTFMLGMSMKPVAAGKAFVRYLSFLPGSIKSRLQTIILRFSSGLEFIRDSRRLAWVSFHTIVIWLFMGFSNYFVFMAFGFDLPVTASFVLLVVVSISILVPSSPGFIGVYHAATVLTLNAYNISDENAVSFALVLHAAQYLPITIMGFYFLKKEHLSLKKLGDEATAPKA